MNRWTSLIRVAEKLLSPEGCPWDREQTLTTLQPYLLEECHELLEAIDLNDPVKIEEELGDVLYALVFIGKLAEREGLFTLDEAILAVEEKLVRRHPHVFDNQKIESVEENWEKIKKQEGKKHPLDGIAPSLPALSRAQKVAHKLKRAGEIPSVKGSFEKEEAGRRLWELVSEIEEMGVDAETALRRYTMEREKKHRR